MARKLPLHSEKTRMLTAALLTLLTLCPEPVSLDGITVERARAMQGRVVTATFLVSKPSYTWRNRRGGVVTVIGAADRDDGAERGAVLKGNRLDLDMGKRATVVGVLRVIDHPACFVGPAFVPAWTEIRVGQ